MNKTITLPRKKADMLYDLFLRKVQEYNETNQDHFISNVYLFGSYLKGKASVHDIDLALEIVPKGFEQQCYQNPSLIFNTDDLQLKRYEEAARFFKSVSNWYSIHHYRDIAIFLSENRKFAMKRIFSNDKSNDAMAFDVSKILRALLSGRELINLS